jgi:glycosyltransferase involved in cell wall biosynthesis
MKVAQLLTASTGGIGRHVASIAPRLEERGHQIRVFCPEVTAEAQNFQELGLDVGSLRSLRRFVGADLVHAHGIKAGWLGIPIAWMFKVPLIVTWHNAILGDGLRPAAVRQTLRAVAMGADLTLGASNDLVLLARRLGAKNARFSPIAAPVLPPQRSTAMISGELSVLRLRTR